MDLLRKRVTHGDELNDTAVNRSFSDFFGEELFNKINLLYVLLIDESRKGGIFGECCLYLHNLGPVKATRIFCSQAVW